MSNIKSLEEELANWLNLARQVMKESSLQEIENKLSDLINQEMFWYELDNMQRWEYDLNNFIDWLKNYKEK